MNNFVILKQLSFLIDLKCLVACCATQVRTGQINSELIDTQVFEPNLANVFILLIILCSLFVTRVISEF